MKLSVGQSKVLDKASSGCTFILEGTLPCKHLKFALKNLLVKQSLLAGYIKERQAHEKSKESPRKVWHRIRRLLKNGNKTNLFNTVLQNFRLVGRLNLR
ncbi:hypothetical protein AHMF7605_08195 [Adhaeribacter arboris]|uniref:Uncharacterized protein n=1 Tax=Adhaeribacter arboris TaxID=2072846 RepID=A0A2T2YDD8_9BACT|nr:hypothetical protein AHMF7605_08195 [Adhaeribacter arboris]